MSPGLCGGEGGGRGDGGVCIDVARADMAKGDEVDRGIPCGAM